MIRGASICLGLSAVDLSAEVSELRRLDGWRWMVGVAGKVAPSV